MSPIFNHHALRGLSTGALNHLRSIILHRLGAADITNSEHAQLHAALVSIDAVLRGRTVQQAPRPCTPAP
ncbi:MAG: hypothetical protein ACK5IP_16785 [Paracoccus sp. (in: a-proteobacteria)]